MNLKQLFLICFLCITFLAVAGGYTYKYFNPEEVKYKEISSDEAVDTINNLRKQIEKVEVASMSWINGVNDNSNIGYLTEVDEEILAANANPEEAIKYLLGSLQMEDLDAFSQAFEPSIFSNALLEHPNDDKYEALLEIMNDLSRGNTLVSGELLTKDYSFSVKNFDNTTVILEYKDGNKVNIEISLAFQTYNHGQNAKGIVFISTSPNEIIRQIKDQV
ncbi:hypothetical protein M3936_19185 [Sutcliffiella horikoshii]|uniref:hypothetical protein n=1 Tax=Sutcliffiella horikoshii TaxID=79883 RepID=UPI00203FC854|nr:hypothetical protein [Sutcliffiella horikoshii]MCM3619697.1 hypothetical protein [Sutcliffiella horikoshii]